MSYVVMNHVLPREFKCDHRSMGIVTGAFPPTPRHSEQTKTRHAVLFSVSYCTVTVTVHVLNTLTFQLLALDSLALRLTHTRIQMDSGDH